MLNYLTLIFTREANDDENVRVSSPEGVARQLRHDARKRVIKKGSFDCGDQFEMLTRP